MAAHISKILEKSANNTPALLGAFKEAKVFNAWKAAASGKIAENSAPERFFGRTLYLKTKNSVWAQELNSLKHSLLEKVNSILGKEAVEDLKFKPGLFIPRQPEKKEKEKKKCLKCKAEYNGSGTLCGVCNLEEKERKMRAAAEILNKEPWAPYESMSKAKEQISQDLFYRVKREMKNKLLDKLITGKKDLIRTKWMKLFNKYTEMIMNKKFSNVEEKDLKGIRQAVQNKINNYSRRRKFR